MVAYFLSDTHLTPEQPDVYNKFLRYLQFIGEDADELYILGDLFDYWIGDDGVDLLGHRPAIEALASLSATGVTIQVMHGNRDFLIGQAFVKMIDAALIPDPKLIELNGRSILLMPCDSLCTDDLEHQRYRSTVLSKKWQQQILSRPLSERLKRALEMRAMSTNNKHEKPMHLMDVNAQAVVTIMEKFDVQTLIHGHTHRPQVHHLVVNSIAARRFVLGDWGRGYDGVIRVDSGGSINLHNAKTQR